MVGESKKRSKTSSSSPVKSAAVVPAPVKLTKEEIFNVSEIKIAALILFIFAYFFS